MGHNRDQLTEEAKALRAKIAVMWDEGKSMRQIAVACSVGRGVINGHVHRMKLPQRTKEARVQSGKVTGHKPRPFNIPPQNGMGGPKGEKTAPKSIEIKSNGAPAPIGLVGDFPDRDRTTCRYIHGDVSSPNWQLCGAPGYPWCDHHAKRFHTPATNRSNVDMAVVRNSGINRIG